MKCTCTLITIMAFIISVFIFSLLPIKTVQALNQNILNKAEESTVEYGSFLPYFYHNLSAKKITTSLIKDELDCPFRCIEEPKCLSFNIAAYPDAKGFHLCELLATDKFGSREKIQSNASFHYFSPVSLLDRITCSIVPETKLLVFISFLHFQSEMPSYPSPSPTHAICGGRVKPMIHGSTFVEQQMLLLLFNKR